MASELINDVPARALAVYAHPDDPEVSCGGTLALWSRAGTEVHLLLCTTGDKGSGDPRADPAALAARRAKEVEAAATILGLAGHEQLGVPDGELSNSPEVRAGIVATIRRVRPDVVICPDPTAVFFGDTYINHHDHRVAGWATLDAVSPSAASPLYFPEAGTAHAVNQVLMSGTLEPNVWVDIGATVEEKIEALLCHASQFDATASVHTEPGVGVPGPGTGEDEDEGSADWLRALLRQRAEEGGRVAGVRFAEGFRRLRLGG